MIRSGAALFFARVLLALPLGLGACASDPSAGYSFAPTTGAGVRTIRVDIAGNDTFSKGAEFELTEAIIKELQRTTPLRVTNSPDADTTLAAVVRTTELRRISRDVLSGQADQLALRTTIDFDWKDNRTGEVRVSRRGFSAVDSFVPAFGTGEAIEVGRRATSQRLAEDIVGELRSGW